MVARRKIVQKRVQADTKATMTGAAPVIDDEDVSHLAKLVLEAWDRIEANSVRTWMDYQVIGKALIIGKQHALNVANKARPEGKKYCADFSKWVKDHGLSKVLPDDSDRRKLIWIMENLPEIEAWRAEKTESERLAWNDPSTIYRIARCKDRGLPRFRSAEPKEEPTAKVNGSAYTIKSGDECERVSQKRWEGNLLTLARKAIGAEQDLSRMVLKPTEPGLKRMVLQAAAALSRIADKLPDDPKPRQPKVEDRVVA